MLWLMAYFQLAVVLVSILFVTIFYRIVKHCGRFRLTT